MMPNHHPQERKEVDLAAEVRVEAAHEAEAEVGLEADLVAEAHAEVLAAEAEAGHHQKHHLPKCLDFLDCLLQPERKIYVMNSRDLENSKESTLSSTKGLDDLAALDSSTLQTWMTQLRPRKVAMECVCMVEPFVLITL